MTVTRTSSPISSSMTAPKMMLASGWATSWMTVAASLTSNRVRSLPPQMFSRMPACAVDGGLEERRADGLTGGGHGAAVAGAVAHAHQGRAGVVHDHLHVGEVGVDEPGRRDEVGDALHTLQQHLVGHLEGRQHRRLVVGDGQQPVVRDDDLCVDLLLELADARVGLHRAAAALEGEGPGHDADGQRTLLLGDLGDDGGTTGAGAATLTGGDEHHVGAQQHLFDLGPVVVGGLTADLGVGAGTEAASHLAPDVELHVRVGHQQRLSVGVDGDELDPLQPGVDHPIDGVAAAAADADDLDDREVVLGIVRHECGTLPSGQCPGTGIQRNLDLMQRFILREPHQQGRPVGRRSNISAPVR